MRQWETERGHGSDEMADILGEALARIGALPDEPTLLDLADAIEFVSRGMLVVELHEKAPDEHTFEPFYGRGPEKHLPLKMLTPGVFKTIPNRGESNEMVLWRKTQPSSASLSRK